MQVTAVERGRTLEITIGNPDGDADDVVVIRVPPLPAALGSQLFALYSGIVFSSIDGDPKVAAENATRIALGAYTHPDATDEERAASDAQWEKVQSLRWEEGEKVCQIALFWNMQGGGLDVVESLMDQSVDAEGKRLAGGPKAQQIVLERANLWTVYSRLTMSLNSGREREIPSPGDMSVTDTQSGTSMSAPAPERTGTEPTP